MILKPKAIEELHFAYLYFMFLAKETLMAGLLVLDKQGFPKDFRFSTATKPNPLQKILYGECLEPYLIESVTQELCKDLSVTPSHVLTNFRYQFSETSLPYPVYLVIKGEGATPKIDRLNSIDPQRPIEEACQEASFSMVEPFQRLEDALNLVKEGDS